MPMKGNNPRAHRNALPEQAKRFRAEYGKLFGYDLPQEIVQQLHAEILKRSGVDSETYPIKNLQNWLSKHRQLYHQEDD